MGLVKEVRSVPLFVYELAHRCRVTLEDKSVSKRVANTVRDTLVSQDANVGVRTVADDWPFPVEHGVEEAPGCILTIAALNDFAATHQRLFEKEDCNFTELRPLEDNSALEVIAYGWHWMLAVGKFKDKHEQRLCLVVDSALRELGVTTEEDGPCGIEQWRHEGIVTRNKMQPKTWKLAQYLYERIGHKVAFSDLVGGDRIFADNLVTADQSIAKQGRKASSWFRANGIPLLIKSSTVDQLIWMESVTSE